MGPEILIVGDRTRRGELVPRVQDLGYAVAPVRERELLTRVAQSPGPAAVIVCLGGADTGGLVQALRRSREGVAIPVLLYGRLEGELRDFADVLELGADRFLEAPVDPDELEAALAELAGPPQLGVQAPALRDSPARGPGDPVLSRLHRTLEVLAARLEAEAPVEGERDAIDLEAMGLDAVPDVDREHPGAAEFEFLRPQHQTPLPDPAEEVRVVPRGRERTEPLPRAPRKTVMDALPKTAAGSAGRGEPDLPTLRLPKSNRWDADLREERSGRRAEPDAPSRRRDPTNERTAPVATASREDVRRDRTERGRVEDERADERPASERWPKDQERRELVNPRWPKDQERREPVSPRSDRDPRTSERRGERGRVFASASERRGSERGREFDSASERGGREFDTASERGGREFDTASEREFDSASARGGREFDTASARGGREFDTASARGGREFDTASERRGGERTVRRPLAPSPEPLDERATRTSDAGRRTESSAQRQTGRWRVADLDGEVRGRVAGPDEHVRADIPIEAGASRGARDEVVARGRREQGWPERQERPETGDATRERRLRPGDEAEPRRRSGAGDGERTGRNIEARPGRPDEPRGRERTGGWSEQDDRTGAGPDERRVAWPERQAPERAARPVRTDALDEPKGRARMMESALEAGEGGRPGTVEAGGRARWGEGGVEARERGRVRAEESGEAEARGAKRGRRGADEAGSSERERVAGETWSEEQVEAGARGARRGRWGAGPSEREQAGGETWPEGQVEGGGREKQPRWFADEMAARESGPAAPGEAGAHGGRATPVRTRRGDVEAPERAVRRAWPEEQEDAVARDGRAIGRGARWDAAAGRSGAARPTGRDVLAEREPRGAGSPGESEPRRGGQEPEEQGVARASATRTRWGEGAPEPLDRGRASDATWPEDQARSDRALRRSADDGDAEELSERARGRLVESRPRAPEAEEVAESQRRSASGRQMDARAAARPSRQEVGDTVEPAARPASARGTRWRVQAEEEPSEQPRVARSRTAQREEEARPLGRREEKFARREEWDEEGEVRPLGRREEKFARGEEWDEEGEARPLGRREEKLVRGEEWDEEGEARPLGRREEKFARGEEWDEEGEVRPLARREERTTRLAVRDEAERGPLGRRAARAIQREDAAAEPGEVRATGGRDSDEVPSLAGQRDAPVLSARGAGRTEPAGPGEHGASSRAVGEAGGQSSEAREGGTLEPAAQDGEQDQERAWPPGQQPTGSGAAADQLVVDRAGSEEQEISARGGGAGEAARGDAWRVALAASLPPLPEPRSRGEGEGAALLAELQRARFSGCSQVRAGEGPERRLWWSEGQVIGGASEVAGESVLGRLWARGLLDATHLDLAVRWSSGDARRDVERLAQAGLLKPQEAQEALREPVRRIVEAIAEGGAVAWALYPGERPAVMVELGVPLAALIAGGVRRGSAIERLRAAVPDELRPRVGLAGPEVLAAELRWPELAAIAGRFDGEATVGELIAAAAADEPEIRAAVHVLEMLGLLAPAAGGDEESLRALDRRRVRERLRLARETDYFALLGLPRDATRAEVRRAHAELTATFREGLEPASRTELAEELAELYAALDEARDVLTDEALHSAYLAQLEEA